MKNVLDVLTERGFVKQTVYGDDLRKKLETESISFYVGFDPTADSLHIGHYIPIMAMAWMQKFGHKPIALCGGATGMIGDPRPTTERKLLTLEEVQYNAECIKKQLSWFLDFNAENAAVVENNYNWISKINVIEFLRDYGKHFNVSYMINKDVVASRLEKGISQVQLANILNVTKATVNDWEHEKCETNFSMLAKIAKYFNVSTDYLLGLED